MAGGIWSFQRQSFPGARCKEICSQSGGASQEAELRGGIPAPAEEIRNFLRSEACLRVVTPLRGSFVFGHRSQRSRAGLTNAAAPRLRSDGPSLPIHGSGSAATNRLPDSPFPASKPSSIDKLSLA